MSIFLTTLKPDSSIRDRIQLLVSDTDKGILLDKVINYYHTWLRDQEIQMSNDTAFTSIKSGKAPRDSKAMLLSLEEQKYFKGCSKIGACH